jgi:hypothetical protein
VIRVAERKARHTDITASSANSIQAASIWATPLMTGKLSLLTTTKETKEGLGNGVLMTDFGKNAAKNTTDSATIQMTTPFIQNWCRLNGASCRQ